MVLEDLTTPGLLGPAALHGCRGGYLWLAEYQIRALCVFDPKRGTLHNRGEILHNVHSSTIHIMVKPVVNVLTFEFSAVEPQVMVTVLCNHIGMLCNHLSVCASVNVTHVTLSPSQLPL